MLEISTIRYTTYAAFHCPARFWVSDEKWHEAINILLGECQLVVMVMGRLQDHPGLSWEVRRLFALVPATKVVLIVPPLSEQQVESRWEDYRQLSGERIPPSHGGAIAATFDEDGLCLMAVTHDRDDVACRTALGMPSSPKG
jgi:hypothetical protein